MRILDFNIQNSPKDILPAPSAFVMLYKNNSYAYVLLDFDVLLERHTGNFCRFF